ncbi:MAG: peptidyl-prolyl cis-trans isomerase [Christensenellaceae bacterium]|nr:peptidyl-prolyl cis-trans isomerase [Christensenellaceae bacterium]
MKKRLAFLAAVVMMMTMLAGCHMVEYDEQSDRLQVVAVIDGEEILKDSILDDYETYKSYAYIDEDSENTEYGKTVAHSLKMQFLNDIVEEKILERKFEEYGIAELSDEEKAELQKEVDEYVESMENIITTEMETLRPAYPDYTEEKLRDTAEYNVMQKYGISDGSYLQELITDRRKEMLLDRVIVEEPLTDAEIEAWYNENIEIQRKDMDESVYNYALAQSDSIPLYCPRDRYFVRVIYVDYIEGIREDAKELREDGKREEADALKEKARAKAEDEANNIMEQLKNGADFETLLIVHSDDDYSKEEYFLEHGFEVYRGQRSNPAVVVNAAVKLETPGQLSEVIHHDGYGYYILELVEIVGKGDIPLEEVHDDIYNFLYEDARYEAYLELLEEWKKEYNLVVYENRLKN